MNSKRLTAALMMSLTTTAIVLIVLFLTDRFLMQEGQIGLFRVFFMAIASGVLLSPFFYWIRFRLEEDTIVATRVSDLELNDRDMREAVDQWVYVHYGKRVDGIMDFNRDDNGSLVCRVTVRDES